MIPVLASSIRASYAKKRTHKVRSGDPLLSIEKSYRISLKKLKKDNRLKTSMIKIGDLIVINN